MPVYIRIKAEALIKVQDPVGDIDVLLQELEDTIAIHSPFELIDEQYNFTVEDAD